MAHLVPWILALVCCLDYCFGQDYPPHEASAPHPRFYRKYTGTNVLHGTLKAGFHSEAACLSACKSDPDCVAVDFNHLAKLCFFHGEKTACGHKMYKHGCNHYAMTNYCTTPIRRYSVVQLEVDNEYDKVHIEIKVDNYHGHGAIFQHKGGDLGACMADCKNSSWCKGVDFSTYGNTCWFHSEKTICNKLAYKYDCMHVRIRDDCSAIGHEVDKYGPEDTGYDKEGHDGGPYRPEGYEGDKAHPDKQDPRYAEEGNYANGPGPDFGEEPYDGVGPDNREGPYDGLGPENREGPYDGERSNYGEGPYEEHRPDHLTEPYDGESPDHKDSYEPDYEAENAPKSPTGPVAYGVFFATGQHQTPHIRLFPLPEHLAGTKPQLHGKGPEYGPNPPVDETHSAGYKPPHVDGPKPEYAAGYVPPHGDGHKSGHGDGYVPPHGEVVKPEHGDGYKPPHGDGYKPTPSNSYKPPRIPRPTPGYPHHKNPLYGLTSPAPSKVGYPNGGGILPVGSPSPYGHTGPAGPIGPRGPGRS